MLTYTGKQIANDFNIDNDRLKNDNDLFFRFKTSGTEGKTKIIFNEIETTMKAFDLVTSYYGIKKGDELVLTSKISNDHIYGYSMAQACKKNNYVLHNDSENIKNNIIKINEGVKYIYTTPSFLINFKDFLKLKTEQIIILTGEKTPENLKNELLDKKLNVYEMFGSTETIFVGSKKIEEEYYSFVSDQFKYENEYYYSPFICRYMLIEDNFIHNDGKIKLSDEIEFVKNRFRFIQRDKNIVKINEQTISLKEIENKVQHIENIEDFCLFKYEKNGLEEIALFHKSNYNDEYLKEIIYKIFLNVNYVPKIVQKIDNFPLTEIGKKNITELKKWIK